MSFKTMVFALVFPLGLGSLETQATDFFCNNYLAGPHPQHFQCVQTTVGPGAPHITAFDQAGASELSASSVSADSGAQASASVANANATPGMLRAFASAEMLGGSSVGAQAVGRADAWFFDGGTVVGTAGVSIGAPIKLRFTLDVGGAFAGGASFTALSEATVDLAVGSLINTRAQIDKFNPTRILIYDIDARVGDSLEMSMKLHASAGAINDANPGNVNSAADVSHTARLFVDVLPGDAAFIGASGHRYATSAASGTTAQNVNFDALANMSLSDASLDVSATASSGLSVSFSSQSASVCTVTGIRVTLIATGNCVIRAGQAGDAVFAAAADVERSFMVSATGSSVSISHSPDQPVTGQTIIFTVTITGTNPSGRISFTDNGSTIGTTTVANGVANFNVPGLNRGDHSIVAQYSGDVNNSASSSVPLGLTIKAAPTTSSSGGGGCALGAAYNGIDPLLALLTLVALCWIVMRNKVKGAQIA